MVEFHDGQYQFKVPFMLYTDFEGIFMPDDEQNREKMNQIKRKGVLPPPREEVRHHIQKRSTCMYYLDGVYTAYLLMEMYLIH